MDSKEPPYEYKFNEKKSDFNIHRYLAFYS